MHRLQIQAFYQLSYLYPWRNHRIAVKRLKAIGYRLKSLYIAGRLVCSVTILYSQSACYLRLVKKSTIFRIWWGVACSGISEALDNGLKK